MILSQRIAPLAFLAMGWLAVTGPVRAQPKKPSATAHDSSTNLSSMTMENQSKQIVQDFLTAVQQGNNEKLAALLHPDVQWQQPGNNRFGGLKKGSTEVFQMAGGMATMADHTLRLTDIRVLAVNGNRVACLIHWYGAQPIGRVLDVDNIDVYTVENGQIVHVDVFSANLAQEDLFWGK